MELGGKLLNSLRIKTQFLERLQSVSVIDGAAHTRKLRMPLICTQKTNDAKPKL